MAELSETFQRLKDDPQGGSQHLLSLLETFLRPFVWRLDEALDKRLVRTRLAMPGGNHSPAKQPTSLVVERTRILSRRL
jgi:hypothetical protein